MEMKLLGSVVTVRTVIHRRSNNSFFISFFFSGRYNIVNSLESFEFGCVTWSKSG